MIDDMLGLLGYLFFVIIVTGCIIVTKKTMGSLVNITTAIGLPYLLVCTFQVFIAVFLGYIDIPCMEYWMILVLFIIVTLIVEASFHLLIYKRLNILKFKLVKETRWYFVVFALIFILYVLYDTYIQVTNIELSLLLQDDFQDEYAESVGGGLVPRMTLILFGTFFFVFPQKIWGYVLGVLCFIPNIIVNTKGIILLPIVAIVILLLYYNRIKHPTYVLLGVGIAGPLIFFVSYFLEYSVADINVFNDINTYRYVGEKLIDYLIAGVQEFNCNIASGAYETKFENLDNVTLSPFYNFLHKFGMAEYVDKVNPVFGYIGKLPTYGEMYSNVNTYIGTLFIFSGLIGGLILHVFWMLLTMIIKIKAELSNSPFFMALYSLYMTGFALGWFEFYFLHTFWIYLIVITVVIDFLFTKQKGKSFKIKSC